MSNIRQEYASRRPDSALAGALLKSVHALQGKCLIELYKQAKDPDFRHDTNTSDLYTRYDALDAMVGFHESITANCLSEAEQKLLRFSDADSDDLAADQSLWDLQVIETSEIELAEAVTPLVASLEAEFAEDLLHLQVRIDCLNNGLPRGVNPRGLHPEALFHAFQKAINGLGIKVAGKLILCQCFYDQIHIRLGDFYKKVNQALSDSGILDEEKSLKNALYVERLKMRGSAVSSKKCESLESAGDNKLAVAVQNSFPGEHSAPPIARSSDSRLSVDLHCSDDDRFIHLLLATESPGTGSMLSPYQRAQIVGALSLLQRSYIRNVEPPGEDEIKTSLSRILYDSGIFNANDLVQKESPAMDFVGKIFKAISGDLTLPEVGKNLICKLQIPTIKLALLDFGFFQNPVHPARRMLNLLSSLLIDIIDDRDAGFIKLQAIVYELLDKFDTNISIFEQALVKIKKLVLKENGSTLNQSHISAQHQPTSRNTAEVVGKTIAKNVDVESLPGSFQIFFTEQFTPYLRVIYADQGPRSQSWLRALELLEKIGNISKSAPAQSQTSEGSSLFNDVEKSLVEIFPAQGDFSALLSEFRKPLSSARRGEKMSATHEVAESSPVMSVEEFCGEHPRGKESTMRGGKSANTSHALPECLKTGTWFEIRQSEGNAKRLLKLSTILEDSDHITFANRSGEVELTLSLRAFLKDLQQNKSRPINDSNIFDRALNSVINNIRQTQNRHGSG